MANLCSRSRRHNGRTPTLESPSVQSEAMAEDRSAVHAHARRPKLSLGLGARPPAASQVLRHRRGPAQRQPRLLVLAHRVAVRAQAPESLRVREEDRHVGPRRRPLHHVSEKVSSNFNDRDPLRASLITLDTATDSLKSLAINFKVQAIKTSEN